MLQCLSNQAACSKYTDIAGWKAVYEYTYLCYVRENIIKNCHL